jgi:hypothetical protein
MPRLHSRRIGQSAFAQRYQIAITPKGNPVYGIRVTRLAHKSEAESLARQWAREAGPDGGLKTFGERVEITVTDTMARSRAPFRWIFEFVGLAETKGGAA